MQDQKPALHSVASRHMSHSASVATPASQPHPSVPSCVCILQTIWRSIFCCCCCCARTILTAAPPHILSTHSQLHLLCVVRHTPQHKAHHSSRTQCRTRRTICFERIAICPGRPATASMLASRWMLPTGSAQSMKSGAVRRCLLHVSVQAAGSVGGARESSGATPGVCRLTTTHVCCYY